MNTAVTRGFATCLIAALAILCCFRAASAAVQQPFDYFSNSWSVVGLKDYDTGVRIQPDNQFAGIQIKIGPSLRPLTAEDKKTLLNGWMPIVRIKADEGSVLYESLIWVTPLPTVKDWQKAFDDSPAQRQSKAGAKNQFHISYQFMRENPPYGMNRGGEGNVGKTWWPFATMLERAETQEAIGLDRSRLRSTRPVTLVVLQ